MSRSPASPIAGSTRTAPWACTSTTSLPVTNRAMSMSWHVMSRKMPPDTRMYVERWRRRVTAGDAHEVQRAERSVGGGVTHEPVGRIEAAVEADLQPRPGPIDGGQGLVGRREVERDRLLAHDRLARRRRCQQQLDVRVGARGDGDRVDVGRRQHLVHRPRRRDAEPVRRRARRRTAPRRRPSRTSPQAPRGRAGRRASARSARRRAPRSVPFARLPPWRSLSHAGRSLTFE